MEFKSLKNIETSFRQIRLFGIVFLCLCALVSVFSVVASFRFAEKQREKIYVLDGGKSLMLALSQDLSQNRCNLQIFLCLFLEKLNMPQNTPVTKAS